MNLEKKYNSQLIPYRGSHMVSYSRFAFVTVTNVMWIVTNALAFALHITLLAELTTLSAPPSSHRTRFTFTLVCNTGGLAR